MQGCMRSIYRPTKWPMRGTNRPHTCNAYGTYNKHIGIQNKYSSMWYVESIVMTYT